MSVDRHPDAEVLGAFLDGQLASQERSEVTAHLAVCDRCIAFLRDAREALEAVDPQPMPEVARPGRFRRWSPLAAAAVVALTLTALFIRVSWIRDSSNDRGIPALIAAAPSTHRTIEPRLSGFRWAELRRLRANETPVADAAELELAGTAGKVLAQASAQDTAASHHAAGVAFLMVRNVDSALEQLKAATEKDPDNVKAWSDFSAALYASAVQQRRPARLPEALAAADRAVALGPSPESLFNRALILERLGLQREAEEAWRTYLSAERDSPWAAEASEHLRALEARPQTRFRDRIAIIETAAMTNDRRVLESELARFSQEMRGWFETDVLGRWGEAEMRGARDEASSLLRAAHNVGEVLREKSGESFLHDVVRVIETPNSPRDRLAAAHAKYRAGRLAYRDIRLQDAERLLRETETELVQAGSPMAGVARMYVASVLFDRNRIEDAAQMAAEAASVAGPTHIALRAQCSLLQGRCDAYAHRWAPALRRFLDAESGFVRLSESSNTAEARAGLAEVLASAGQVDRAWQYRLDALQSFSAVAGGTRLLAALAAVTQGESQNQRWAPAEAMSKLEIAEAQRMGDPLLVADAYKRRARFHLQIANHENARADLREARAMASRAPASGLRDRFLAECALVDGLSWRAAAPALSLDPLNTVVAFAKTSGDRRMIPEALLERARTLRALGRDDEAWTDLESAVTEIEDRRTTAEGGPGATFDSAVDLFHEAIVLLAEKSRTRESFEYAERAHARALRDFVNAKAKRRAPARSATASEIEQALPQGAALYEYVLLPDALLGFRIDRHGLQMARSAIGRNAIESDVRRLRTLMVQRAPVAEVQTAAARLHEVLIAPLDALAGEEVTSRIIVGDRLIQAIPWAALWDAEKKEYLIERCEISVAPSASIWMYNRTRSRRAGVRDRLLLVTADTDDGNEVLERLGREANGIAAVYADPLLLRDAAATPARLLEESAKADVVHYAGHARAGRGLIEAALLFGEGRELTASEIARAELSGTRLVVLGACDTMTGDTADLEGAPDLSLAFLAAGVRSVIGTLWPVQDGDAAKLFVAFHEHLQSSSSVAAALREAQLEMLRSPQGPAHPSSWAVAELMGSSS